MKKGDRFIVTSGEYSDYGIRDSFVVLKNFSFDVSLARWLNEHGDNGQFSYDHGQDDQAFLASLRSGGYVADHTLNRVHLHDYSRPNLEAANDAHDEPEQASGSIP